MPALKTFIGIAPHHSDGPWASHVVTDSGACVELCWLDAQISCSGLYCTRSGQNMKILKTRIVVTLLILLTCQWTCHVVLSEQNLQLSSCERAEKPIRHQQEARGRWSTDLICPSRFSFGVNVPPRFSFVAQTSLGVCIAMTTPDEAFSMIRLPGDACYDRNFQYTHEVGRSL